MKMARSIIKINPAKALTYNTLVNPLNGDKFVGIDTSIYLYEIEDGDKTKEVEESEILVICDLSLAAIDQKLIKIGSHVSIFLIIRDTLWYSQCVT